MIVDYKELPEESKVWIYPSSRKFYPKEIEVIEQKIETFSQSWGHKEGFKVSYRFLYNRFVIFYIDNSSPVLSSLIDIQVQFILGLEKEYEVSLLDKMNVCFKQGEYVQYKELKEFKKLIKNKAISEKTIVFDNLVATKQDLEDFWEVPITESWYSRFLR